MKTYRVKHPTIPVSEFKPVDFRQKILRWFTNEEPNDYRLDVEHERDGEYVLVAYSRARVVPQAPPKNILGVPALIEVDHGSLAQSVVDKIEVAPNYELAEDADFVIFEDSPLVQQQCRRSGQ